MKVLKLGDGNTCCWYGAPHRGRRWSMGVLVNGVGGAVSGVAAGAAVAVAGVAGAVRGLCAMATGVAERGALQQQMEYWKQQVEGAPEALQMPTDRPRSASHSGRGANVMFHMEKKLAGGLKELGRREGATLFMVLLAGVKVLLGK